MRYSLYHLGFEPPEKPPIRIARLRLYFDGPALRETLARVPGGDEVTAALVDPGGAGRLPREAGRVAAAAFFHRVRLRFRRRRSPAPPRDSGKAQDTLWRRFEGHLAEGLRCLNEAFLAELLAALARRKRRDAGENVPPCLSRAASRWIRSGEALDLLGPPDPLTPAREDEASSRAALEPFLPNDGEAATCRVRGTFRHGYRGLLNTLRPSYLALARDAVERGALREEEDAFFLPFDLAADLAVEPAPRRLPGAVASNRREYESLLQLPGPPEVLPEGKASVDPECVPPRWPAAAIWPLP